MLESVHVNFLGTFRKKKSTPIRTFPIEVQHVRICTLILKVKNILSCYLGIVYELKKIVRNIESIFH